MSCARSERLSSKNAPSRLIHDQERAPIETERLTRSPLGYAYQRTTLSQPKDDADRATQRVIAAAPDFSPTGLAAGPTLVTYRKLIEIDHLPAYSQRARATPRVDHHYSRQDLAVRCTAADERGFLRESRAVEIQASHSAVRRHVAVGFSL